MGKLPTAPGEAASVRDLLHSSGAAPALRVVKGTMTEKCPVAGCWFLLRDDTGTIKVDTKDAGFVVIEIPVGTTLEVSGRIAADSRERHLVAAGLRY